MAKISELKKTELLETAVLSNDIQAVTALFLEHKTFEFTARALGLALRFCGAEMLKTLLENGATFAYEATAAFKKKYNCSVSISNSYSFAINYTNYIFPAHDVQGYGNPLISDEERKACLHELHEYSRRLSELLYQSILYQDDAIYTELIGMGITKIPEDRKKILSGEFPYARLDSYDRYDRERFQYRMSKSSDAKMKTMLERAIAAMNIEIIRLFPSDFYQYDFNKSKDIFITRYCSPILFDFFLKKTNMLERVKKWDMLFALIDRNNAEGLSYALHEKWVEKESDIEQLLKYAQEKSDISPEVLACLISKTENTAKPIEKQFSLTPSAADLKKIWGTKKAEDGTLIITSYKGLETDVIIPDKIGKTAVTAIDKDAFNPEAPRLTEMQRKARMELCSVFFPETIGVIPENLFIGDHPNLSKIILSEGLQKIGYNAFRSCTAIEEIVIPESVTEIGSNAFAGCRNLKNIHLPQALTSLSNGLFKGTGLESFDIPSRITEIGTELFSECRNLKHVTLPNHIEKIPNQIFSNCTNLKEFAFPENLKEIGEFSFANSALEECIIPENVEAVGFYAFGKCKALRSLKVPVHTKLGIHAFTGCDALADTNEEIIVNGHFFGFKGQNPNPGYYQDSDFYLRPLVLNDRIQSLKLNDTNGLPQIVYKEHHEMGENPDLSHISVGDTLHFGRFPNDTDYEMKPLEWQVLAVEDDRVLLITVHSIMTIGGSTHIKDWETSYARKLLNETFFRHAFTEKEQAQIETVTLKNPKNPKSKDPDGPDTEDRVFLLSFNEAETYLPTEESRKASATKYALHQYPVKRDVGFWDLRTKGSYGAVAVSEYFGDYTMTGNHVGQDHMRPCIYLKKAAR